MLLFVVRLAGGLDFGLRGVGVLQKKSGFSKLQIPGFSKKQPGFSESLDLRCVGVLQKNSRVLKTSWLLVGSGFSKKKSLGSQHILALPKINHFPCILRRLEDQGAQVRNQGSHF